MLVWVMEEVWLWWVIHVIQVLCLAQLTCYGCEELVEYARCVWLGAVWVERGVSG